MQQVVQEADNMQSINFSFSFAILSPTKENPIFPSLFSTLVQTAQERIVHKESESIF